MQVLFSRRINCPVTSKKLCTVMDDVQMWHVELDEIICLIGACLNAAFLFFGLRRRGIYQAKPGWALFFGQLAGALFLLSGVTMWVAGQFDWIAMQAHPFLRIGALLMVMGIGGVVYFGALMLTGFRPSDFKRIAR
ncbi:MAG: hypothetical protein EOP02_13200 [Proteobacteria bacterium]|nr:MAG: hypothetical protein EOP02_13200 [Pseudomonadota bacterium]